MPVLHVHMKGYIQPFERELALQELQAVSSAEPRLATENADELNYSVECALTAQSLAERLAYWETVQEDGEAVITVQSLREATVNLVRNGIALDALRGQLPFGEAPVPLPNRRCLRYGPHGIHEYRGKFFPQLVRSLINISGTQPGGVVADPMSGSATTAVEAILAGCTAKGIDMNPLSVDLGRSKCQLLSASAEALANGYQQIREELLAIEPREHRHLPYFESLPKEDQEYLLNWFSTDVLQGLDDISCSIQRLTDVDTRALARISLSNIIRSVSWQKEDDLRVRKEIRLDVEIDPKKEFLEELGRSVRAVLALLHQTGPMPPNRFEIIDGDAKRCGTLWGENSVDVIITSPPYATALPYLDTDRLSLCYIGLLPRPEHRVRDQLMIGNREVTDKQRLSHWARYQIDRAALPETVCALIDTIDTLNANGDVEVGFRRRNLPALLSKYFFDMKDVLEGMRVALRPGAFAYVVVGNNHTIAGGHRVDIQTASLLRDVAATVGLEVLESIQMDMLVSRDIFRKNAMATEEILVFKKPE